MNATNRVFNPASLIIVTIPNAVRNLLENAQNESINYKLSKKSILPNNTKIYLPPRIPKERYKLDIRRLTKKEFGEYIAHFVKVMNKYRHPTELNLLNRNIPSLTTLFFSDLEESRISERPRSGFYSKSDNFIAIKSPKHIHVIYHELLHASSSYIDKQNNISYSGFSQTSKEQRFGVGINEGYTQFLTERYFSNNEVDRRTYIHQKNCASILESIIGSQKMEHFYFTANLKGLINEMKKYASTDSIMEFLYQLDYITQNRHLFKNKENNEFFQESINKITSFIKQFLVSYLSNCTDNVREYNRLCATIKDNYIFNKVIKEINIVYDKRKRK